MSASFDTMTSATELLRDGERLDQQTFHELYKQTPPGFKAELIGGVVHVASPLKVPHGNHHALVVGWLWLYHVSTPGTRVRDNTTTILDDSNEPQPDAVLVIEPEFGGQSTVDAEDFAIGAPELVVEIADTTLKTDLNQKLPEYEQTGVREYVIVAIPQKAVHWFRLGKDGYEEQSAEMGVFRSSVFPGLWLNADALMELDSRTLQEGLATPEHAAFVAALQRARADQ